MDCGYFSSLRSELIPDLLMRTLLLALSGDWQLLKERALTFLNDEEKKARSDLKRIPDHEFLCGTSR